VNEELHTGEWENAIAKMRRANVIRVLVTGGEPFMRSDLADIIGLLVSNKMMVSIATNGTIENAGVYDILERNRNIVSYIQISLDGYNPESNDPTRGELSFYKICNSIRRYKQMKIHVKCRITLNKHNYRFFRETFDFIKETLGVNDITVNEIQEIGRGRSDNTHTLTEQERIEFVRNYADILPKINFMDCEIGRIHRFVDGFSDSKFAGGRLVACMKAFKGLHILQNGSIVVCDALPQLVLGNILTTEDLSRLWKENGYLEILRRRCAHDLADFQKCRECEFINYCTGSCPVIDYKNGKILCSNDDDRCYKYLADIYGIMKLPGCL